MYRRTFLKTLIAAGTATLFGGSAYGYRSTQLEVSRERIVRMDLRQGLRIVAISDVHAPCFYASASELVEIINAESPDIFIVAGDTIDKRGNEHLAGMFKPAKAKIAKIATLGNWERDGTVNLVELKRAYESAGFSLLVNAACEVAGLTVVGLDDLLYGFPDYQILNQLPTRSGPILVVSHCPGTFDVLATFSHPPMIVLSGHTHGGQIAPFGIVLVTPPGSGSYIQGWYHKGKHSMYVMRGIGTSPGLPIRIGARPELLVLDIVGIASS